MCTTDNNTSSNSIGGLNNDVPTFPASLVKFDGSNYLLWSQTMLLAIGSGGGEYVGYLTGKKKKPTSGEALIARWIQEDSFVKSYLIYHMTPDIATRYMFIATALEIWTSVKQVYSTSRNGVRIFELKKKINEHKQEGMTMTHYYATLCSMYQELDVYRSGKYQEFDSTVVAELQKLDDEERVYQFLMGLSEAHKKVRQEILMRDPLPTLQQAFKLVDQQNREQMTVNPSAEHSLLSGSSSVRTPRQIVKTITRDRMFEEGIFSSHVASSRTITSPSVPISGNFSIVDVNVSKGNEAGKTNTKEALMAVENRKVGKRKAVAEAVGNTCMAECRKAAKFVDKPKRGDFSKTFCIENPGVRAVSAEKAPYEAGAAKMVSDDHLQMDAHNEKQDNPTDNVDEQSDRSNSEVEEESGQLLKIDKEGFGKLIVNPGPVDRTVLNKQHQHISEAIWNGNERKIFNVIGSSRGIDQWHLDDEVSSWIDTAGFGVMLTSSCIVRTDNGLIQALIERWRPETNTFHLPVGECTITLEDVGFILGLPLAGEAVVDAPLKWKMPYIFRQFFGFEIPEKSIASHGVRLTALREWFAQLPEHATREERINQAKAFLLDCIGSVLLPTSGKSYVHAKFCKFLENLDNVANYSWGSAVLSHLYRELTKATNPESTTFCGCAALLQIWAWERISIGRPAPRLNSHDLLPRAMAWRHGKGDRYDDRRDGDNPHHTGVIFYRGELDQLDEIGWFVWEPYLQWVRLDGKDKHHMYRIYGSSTLPLIYFDCVEYQMPDRVLRQFGLRVEIPVNPPSFDELRKPKDTVFERIDPLKVHIGPISVWAQNEQEFTSVVANKIDRVCRLEEYIHWYRRITRLRISPVQMSAPPSSKYRPRSVFSELQAHNVIESAADYVRKTLSYIPPSAVEIREIGNTWVQKYQNFSQSWRDPDFKYDFLQPPGFDDPIDVPHELSDKD